MYFCETKLTHQAAKYVKLHIDEYRAFATIFRGQIVIKRLPSRLRASLNKLLWNAGAKGDVSQNAIWVASEPYPGILSLASAACKDPLFAAELGLPSVREAVSHRALLERYVRDLYEL